MMSYCIKQLFLFSPLQSEKFRHVSKLTTKLASLASEATGSVYDSRVEVLQQIIEIWENNKELAVNGKGKTSST